MSSVMRDDDYEWLIKRFPLRPIRSEEENERAFAISDELTDAQIRPEFDYGAGY